jgi:hypothetical protein
MELTCVQKQSTQATTRLNVLFLYDLAQTINQSTYDHLRCFRAYSGHQIYYTHALNQLQSLACLDPFDAVVLHYSLGRPGNAWLPQSVTAVLEQYQGVKAMFLLDVGWKQDFAVDWGRRLGVNLIFTTKPAEQLPLTYPQLDGAAVACVTVSPRYRPLGVRIEKGRPSLEQMVHSFDEAVLRLAGRKRPYELTARVLLATDVRGKMEPLDTAGIYTDPLNVMKAVGCQSPVADSAGSALPCQGRLTTRCGKPAFTDSHFQAGSIYFSPFQGNNVALYTGSAWETHSFQEISLALTEVRAHVNYDVFLSRSGNELALSLSAWADGQTRQVALFSLDAVLVDEDDPRRRYLGTIRGLDDQMTEDSLTRRFVWNHYHRVSKYLYTGDTTQHTYDSPDPRPWNAEKAVQFEFVLGQPQEVQLQCNSYSRTVRLGAAAIIFPMLDGGLKVYPELQRGLGNFHPNFVGNTTSGTTFVDAGHHTVGVGECGDAGGATFAFAWLHGSVLC